MIAGGLKTDVLADLAKLAQGERAGADDCTIVHVKTEDQPVALDFLEPHLLPSGRVHPLPAEAS